MKLSNAQLLGIISFLHALATGIALSGITRHLMKHGGNHIILGTLVGLLYVSKIISKQFVVLYERGKKFTILVSLYTGIMCFFTTVLFSAWYLTFLSRIIFSLTDQVHTCTKQLATILEPTKRIKIWNWLEMMQLAGKSTGSIIGGYLYQNYKRFPPIGLVSACILILALFLTYLVESDFSFETPTKSTLFQLPSKCYQRLKKLRAANYHDQLDHVLLKIAYIATFTILNTRFALLIYYNYSVNYIVMGYVKSYNYSSIYIASILAPFMTENTRDKKHLCEISMLYGGILLVALYYAPHYHCFLIFFVLLVFNYVVVSTLLEQDAFDLKYDRSLNEATDTIVVLISIFAPIVYGAIFHYFGPRAFKISSLLPTLGSMYILNRRFIFLKKRRYRRNATRFKEED